MLDAAAAPAPLSGVLGPALSGTEVWATVPSLDDGRIHHRARHQVVEALQVTRSLSLCYAIVAQKQPGTMCKRRSMAGFQQNFIYRR